MEAELDGASELELLESRSSKKPDGQKNTQTNKKVFMKYSTIDDAVVHLVPITNRFAVQTFRMLEISWIFLMFIYQNQTEYI